MSLSSPALRKAFVWAALILPPLVYLLHWPSFGTLQNNDYYGILARVLDGDHLTHDLGTWLTVKSNEHRATFPTLIYVLNTYLFAGTNRTLALFTLALMALVAGCLYRLLPPPLRGSPWEHAGLAFIVASLAFTPVAAHNVAMAFSGTQWFLANALAVLSITVLVRRTDAGQLKPLLAITAMGLVGALSYSTSLAMWPALLVGAIALRRDRRQLALLALAAVAVYLVVFLRFKVMPAHPEPNTSDFGTLWRYLGIYMGSLFTTQPHRAIWLGWAALAAWPVGLGLLWVWGDRALRRLAVPFVMLQIYAFASALGTAIGRSGKGEAQALASRYASLPGLYWIGLLVLAALLLHALRQRHPRLAMATTTAFVLIVGGLELNHYRRGLQTLDAFVNRASRQPVTALSLRRGYHDDALIQRSMTPSPQQVWEVEPFLRATGHVPFDRQLAPPEPRTVDPTRLVPKPGLQLQGYISEVVKVGSGRLLRLKGWAWAPEGRVAEVLLIDNEGRVRGELITGIHRPSVAKSKGRGAMKTGWEGYVAATPAGIASGRLKAYGRLEWQQVYRPLRLPEKLRLLVASGE